MKIVIIGAGPAGVTVAETVRSLDQQAELIILSAEPYPPYSPPAMADHFLTGSQAHLWRGDDWPQRMGVDYRMGVIVTGVDPRNRQVFSRGGEVFTYDRLVIASGSRLYAPLAGSDLPGIYNFKSLSAAETLMQRVRRGEAHSALIVGGGFIGMEIALLLRHLGVEVVQIEMLGQVMAGMLDAETAQAALEQMRQRGIDVRLNTRAEAFVGNGYARGVRLTSGEMLSADLLIAATGVRPNLEFLQGSGIDTQWGVRVDDHLRTNSPDVYAAGDVVETPDRLTGETYVHAIFPNALEQGRVVGLNLAGLDVSYPGAERMNSLKHLGLPILAVGLKAGDEVLHARVNEGTRTLYLKENRLVGFQMVGELRAAGVLHALIETHQDLRRLKDHLLESTFGEGLVALSVM
jgi:NADPH-dependent 2,4-dienoyl-CoA reductase/sulfur reductase-like enzyme